MTIIFTFLLLVIVNWRHLMCISAGDQRAHPESESTTSGVDVKSDAKSIASITTTTSAPVAAPTTPLTTQKSAVSTVSGKKKGSIISEMNLECVTLRL